MFGTIGNGEALRARVLSRYGETSRMPAAERALLALRELSPMLADQVLERARYHYVVDSGECTAPAPAA